jgi:hypothetical protein
MDFSKLNAVEHGNKGSTLSTIIGPDGNVLDGVTVTMLSFNSDVARACDKLDRKNQSLVKVVTDEMRQAAIERKLAALTVSWTCIDLDGKELECNKDNALKLYSTDGFDWFTIQLIKFASNDASFFSKANIS